ncbi:MAG: FAD-binding oxidoreductase, partial [Thioalkalivibrio sp.]
MNTQAPSPKLDTQQRQGLIQDLSAALPAEGLLHTTEDLRPYECDALSVYRRLPMA